MGIAAALAGRQAGRGPAAGHGTGKCVVVESVCCSGALNHCSLPRTSALRSQFGCQRDRTVDGGTSPKLHAVSAFAEGYRMGPMAVLVGLEALLG